MTKQAFHLGEGFKPTKLDGTPYIDGEVIEGTKYEDDLVRMGVLIPGEEFEDDSDSDPDPEGGGEGEDQLPETAEEWESLYEHMKVPELEAALKEADVDIPKGSKKADLVDLIMDHQFGGDDE